MSVSPSFRTFVLDQLGRVAKQVRAKNMFGGVGIYAGELFFALIDDDILYFKVDDVTRPDFEARGMKAFSPYGEGGEVMQYYRVPDELLDEHEALAPWVNNAIAVAERARKKRTRRAPKRRTSRR